MRSSIIVRLDDADTLKLHELNAEDMARKGDDTREIPYAETVRRLIRRAHHWHVTSKGRTMP